jgi:peptide deformylase
MPKKTQTGVRQDSAPPTIRLLGDPILSNRAREIRGDLWNAVPDLVDRLTHAMRAYEGQGLSAPQIGESLRVIVIEARPTNWRPDVVPSRLYAMVNPEITYRSPDTDILEEGCISIGGHCANGTKWILLGKVKRARSVVVEWRNPVSRRKQSRTFSGFLAQIVQHECDHLDGRLCSDLWLKPHAQHVKLFRQ